MSADDLERLAEAGRARKKAQAEAQDASKTSEENEKRRERQWVLWGSVSAYARWGWVLATIGLGALVAWITSRILPASWFVEGSGEDGSMGGLVVTMSLFLGLPPARALRGFFGRRAVTREGAWAASLPFQLDGYLRTLEGTANDGTLTLRLGYAGGSPPDPGFIAEVLLGAGFTATDAHRATITFSYEDSVSTNHHVARCIHEVMPALLALHGKWPLSRVSVSASWT